jgi:hypothetical protein
VDGSQVSVFEEGDEVSLSSFLESHDGGGLEAEISLPHFIRHQSCYELKKKACLEILSDFTNKSLEGQLADEEVGVLLVATDFTKSDGTRPEPMGLLDTTSSGLSSLPGLLGRELFTRGLATSGLASCLLKME